MGIVIVPLNCTHLVTVQQLAVHSRGGRRPMLTQTPNLTPKEGFRSLMTRNAFPVTSFPSLSPHHTYRLHFIDDITRSRGEPSGCHSSSSKTRHQAERVPTLRLSTGPFSYTQLTKGPFFHKQFYFTRKHTKAKPFLNRMQPVPMELILVKPYLEQTNKQKNVHSLPPC